MSRETLTRLDIDHSSRVTDAATTDLVQLNHLVLLSLAGQGNLEIFHQKSSNGSFPPGTSLSNESLARLLLGLQKLRFLPNGDFLCDCLEWLAYDSSEEFLPKGFSGFDIKVKYNLMT